MSVGGGFSYGALGYSHHATEDLAIMRAIPNLRVFCPCDFWEVEQITKKVIDLGGVNYIRIDKSSYINENNINEVFIAGKGRVLSDGNDITLITCGGIAEVAIEAKIELLKHNINCRVISMHTIKPIDKNIIIDSVNETDGIVTLEEHSLIGGLGGAVSEVLMQEGVYPKKFKMLGLESKFSTIVGSQTYLRKINKIDKKSVIDEIIKLLK